MHLNPGRIRLTTPDDPPTTRRSERGNSLLVVMAIMIVGGLTIAALLSYAQTNLRAARSFQSRTERVQASSDVVDLAISSMRFERTAGIEGSSPVTVTYESATATCTGETGSGVVTPQGGYADRKVRCTGSIAGQEHVKVRVEFLDDDGQAPGNQVQILDRYVD